MTQRSPGPQPGLDARLVADRIAGRAMADDRVWGSYTLDLTLEGLLALSEATGDPRYADHALSIIARRGWDGQHLPAPGTPPFTHLVFDAWRVARWEGFEARYVRDSEQYRREIPRGPDGAVLHPRRDGGQAMLIDSLQEYAARMARAAWLSGDMSFARECVEQFEVHRRVLRDGRTGLYHQGRGWLDDPEALSPGAWSRGQGWLIRGMVESLRYLPPGSPEHARLRAMLVELADALLAVQAAEGLWHALPARPPDRSPPESSGSAMIAAALARAVHEGLLPNEPYGQAALRAAKALRSYVTADGVVLNACPGPGPLVSEQGYLDVKGFPPDGDHGPGAVLQAVAAEILLSGPS